MACCADAAQPVQHRMPDCSIPTREAAVANAIFDRWDGRSRQSTGPFSGRSPLANVTQCNVVGAPGNPKRRPEGKLVCNPESLFGAKDCVVVSVGCQNDYRFEEYLYRTTSCRVEVFDCTGKGRGWKVPEWIRSRVTLHDLCLGVPQWRYNQTRNRYQMVVAPSRKQTYETVTYHEMLAKAGLTVAPTFLKLDCEGCEVDLFRSLIDDGDTYLLPDQIAAEMHYPYGFDTDPNDFFSARFTDVHAKCPSRIWPMPCTVGTLHNRWQPSRATIWVQRLLRGGHVCQDKMRRDDTFKAAPSALSTLYLGTLRQEPHNSQ